MSRRARASTPRSHPNQMRASAKKKLRKKEKALELELEAVKLGLSIPELQQKKFVEAMEAARKRKLEADKNGWVPRNNRASRPPYYNYMDYSGVGY